ATSSKYSKHVNETLVKLLISSGAKIDMVNADGHTAFHILVANDGFDAQSKSNDEIVKIMIHSALTSFSDSNWFTLYTSAIESENQKWTKKLIDCKVNVNALGDRRQNLLMFL